MMARGKTTTPKQISLKGEIKSICDVMRRSNCAGAMQYVPELTWLLFVAMNSPQWAGDAMARVRELFLDYSKQAIKDRALRNL